MKQDRSDAHGANGGTLLLRHITRSYMIGLAIIAMLSVGIHVLLDRVIAQQQDSATVINVAGRQRMLSQRIGLYASDLHAGDRAAAAHLAETAASMLRAENALVGGNDLGLKNTLYGKARAYFLEGAEPLDQDVRRFVALAQQFAATGPAQENEADYRELQRYSHDSLLPRLHQSVKIFEGQANRRVDVLRQIQVAVLAVILIALSLEAMFIFRPLVRRVRHYASQLYDMATRDTLTGLFNRRYMMDTAGRDLLLSRRSGKPLSVMLIDLDRFKFINDTHGHAAGDAVLRKFAETAQSTLRMSDVIGRIGGEEFVVLLHDTNMHGMMVVAQKLIDTMAQVDAPGLPRFTISAGAALLTDADKNFDDLLARADKALYRAKQNGRNRLEVDDSPAPSAMAVPVAANTDTGPQARAV